MTLQADIRNKDITLLTKFGDVLSVLASLVPVFAKWWHAQSSTKSSENAVFDAQATKISKVSWLHWCVMLIGARLEMTFGLAKLEALEQICSAWVLSSSCLSSTPTGSVSSLSASCSRERQSRPLLMKLSPSAKTTQDWSTAECVHLTLNTKNHLVWAARERPTATQKKIIFALSVYTQFILHCVWGLVSRVQ